MELAQAVYFPYLKIENSGWLKTAALYYSKLLRIVPDEVNPLDDRTSRTLIDECAFIENIDGAHEAEMISLEFVNEMRRNSTWPETLPPIFRTRRNFTSVRFPVRMHADKFTYSTLGALAEMGLAQDYRSMTTRQRWIKVEPRAAAIYITMLAERMAERRGIAAVTDDPLFQKWMRYFELDPDPGEPGEQTYRLPELVIRAAVPRGIEHVPVKKIIDFRRKHDAERLRFFDAIESMSRDLLKVREQTALEDCLQQHQALIENAVEELRRALRGVQIDAVAGLLGVSLPPLLAQFVQAPSAGLVAGGISLAAGLKTLGYWRQYTRVRDLSPWTYVLSLRKLGARGFLESAKTGEMLV